MRIIGCDLHARQQTLAMLDTGTGEVMTRTLLVEDRFPAIWRPSQELLDLRALLLQRHHWVRLRTQVQCAAGHRARERTAARSRSVELRRTSQDCFLAVASAHL